MVSRDFYKLFLLVFLTLVIAACDRGDTSKTAEGSANMGLQMTSTAFADGEAIPKRYTCDGDNISPQLAWSGVPEGTKSLALILDDPDAPSGSFIHWVIFDIPPTLNELSDGVQGIGTQGANSTRKQAYFGPCPPPGPAHRYFFKLYALDRTLDLSPGSTKADVEKAMQAHILAQGQIMGKFGR